LRQTNPISLVVRPRGALIRLPLAEDRHSQRRKRHCDTVWPVVTDLEPAGNHTAIADIRSAEKFESVFNTSSQKPSSGTPIS
jgi:hypothetical protein